MRKTKNDALARTEAEREIGDLLMGAPIGAYADSGDARRDAEFVVSSFKAAEFETVTRKVGDEEIALRRVVMTGPWMVDPTAVKATTEQ